MERFVNITSRVQYLRTIGIDFFIRNVTLDRKHLRLQMWDMSGIERFQHWITRHVLRLCGLFYVYDVTDQQTFDCPLTNWILRLEINGNVTRIRMLIGNK